VQYESFQHISDEIKKDVEFGAVDLDGDGLLDKEEVKIAFTKAGMDFTVEEINVLFEKFDIDGSGKLDEGEYARLLKEKKRGRAAVTRKEKKKGATAAKEVGDNVV
jgi:Ca2+-binding EF-hand superfamily protein